MKLLPQYGQKDACDTSLGPSVGPQMRSAQEGGACVWRWSGPAMGVWQGRGQTS